MRATGDLMYRLAKRSGQLQPLPTPITGCVLRTGNNMANILKLVGAYDQVRNGLVSFLKCEDRADELMSSLAFTWKFQINSRAANRLGRCCFPSVRNDFKGIIEISDVLLQSGNENDRNETIVHEVAHAINYHLFTRNDGHGPNWCRIMISFGLEPKRCGYNQALHQKQNEKRGRRKGRTYRCVKCFTEFQTGRRLKNPQRKIHRNCGGGIVEVLTGE